MMWDVGDLVLAALGLAFAVSIGAHYTGACMGMAYAGGAIRRGPALAVMAVLAFAGAAIASGHVVTKVGLSIVPDGSLTVASASIVVGVAFLLTSAYNQVRLPTSTIQILVFSLVGVGLAAGIAIDWGTIGGLLIVWALAPVAAAGLGYAFTVGLTRARAPAPSASSGARGTAMVLVGAALVASFAMGANDVANAVAVFVTTHLASVAVAGVLGGAALAVGVLTWGRPLLETVAFDIVRLDPKMATAAQLAQGTVVLGVVLAAGTFTSMNQALVGAMAGAGLARHRSAVQWPMIRGILLGWALGPTSGLVAGYAGVLFARLLGVPL
ncbi:MAG TPA: inorganic phosphate transporter [Thermoplasmata archaeon]|nr:inorganic phosphate transporter [Thermoplasmata archaeon]